MDLYNIIQWNHYTKDTFIYRGDLISGGYGDDVTARPTSGIIPRLFTVAGNNLFLIDSMF